MNNQVKKAFALAGLSAVLVLTSADAFALGRSKKSGYRGWETNSASNPTSGGNQVVNENPRGGDANPVPEPASLVLFGTALAGLGGYRGIKARLAARKK